jgi:hypothetical protein
MAELKKVVEQATSILRNSTPANTELTLQDGRISLYTDPPADDRDIIRAIANIKRAFPSLPIGFYDTFDDRVRAKLFSKQRLTDAVDFVIDNCVYPTPTIANFVSFDRTVEFKTYDQICKIAINDPDIWNQYSAIRFPDMPQVVWIFNNDVIKYKLEKYKRG